MTRFGIMVKTLSETTNYPLMYIIERVKKIEDMFPDMHQDISFAQAKAMLREYSDPGFLNWVMDYKKRKPVYYIRNVISKAKLNPSPSLSNFRVYRR